VEALDPGVTVRKNYCVSIVALLAALSLPVLAQEPSEPSEPEAPVEGTLLDGVTFAAEPGVLYAPIREMAKELELPLHWDEEKETAYLKDQPVPDGSLRTLLDGTLLMPVRDLTRWEATVAWDTERDLAHVTRSEQELWVRNGEKRVVVNRAKQRMRAWQGDRLILDSRVSTGGPGNETPLGSFRAGPYRARMHYSSLYDNAPMPWSVQVTGNVFVHGYHSVPPRAASHGCVRLPIRGKNPARWFYRWVDNGTPIKIAENWGS
jgi:hypothetical protein